MKGNKRRFLIIVFCIIVAIIIFPYIKAEVLTVKYGNLFEKEFKQTGMISSITYCKVLEYSKNQAEVLYVEGDVAGYKMWFSYENGTWIMVRWSCIWSTTGSAEGFCWPFYR